MRGSIDYIVVAFDGNNFDGSILEALSDSMEKGIIDVLDIAIILRDENGQVASMEVSNVDSEIVQIVAQAKETNGDLITTEDIAEIGELLEDNSSAGLLIIEQLWAKPLKKALIDANGTLIAEGRIHPEAALELE
ncbi:MAG: hypothetical protein BMS9Abin25_0388 [Gammaproteobacteria bacterium]|nr:MAG: hypothetical protein BMS9Abin25_0388 [Gammaproteobacteria bacterium]